MCSINFIPFDSYKLLCGPLCKLHTWTQCSVYFVNQSGTVGNVGTSLCQQPKCLACLCGCCALMLWANYAAWVIPMHVHLPLHSHNMPPRKTCEQIHTCVYSLDTLYSKFTKFHPSVLYKHCIILTSSVYSDGCLLNLYHYKIFIHLVSLSKCFF